MLKHIPCLVLLSIIVILHPTSGFASPGQELVQKLFSTDMETIDLARAKLEIDKIVDPSISIDTRLAELDATAERIRKALPPNPTSWQKIQMLRDFLYKSGKWNGNIPFAYNHEDPLGSHIPNKLLSTYLDTRKGNCVTMPLLFLFLAERLDLKVTLSLAPLHVFVKFTDDEGKTWNLETTSGAGATRDAWYRQQLPMTEKAVENGIYLRPLSKQESLAVIAAYLVETSIARKTYSEAYQLGEIIQQNYPDFTYVIIKQATALYYILQRDYYQRYPNPKDVPEAEHARLRWLQQQNHNLFKRAENLGWQPQVD